MPVAGRRWLSLLALRVSTHSTSMSRKWDCQIDIRDLFARREKESKTDEKSSHNSPLLIDVVDRLGHAFARAQPAHNILYAPEVVANLRAGTRDPRQDCSGID